MKLEQALYIPAALVLVAAAMIGCGDDDSSTSGTTTTSSSSGAGAGGSGGSGGAGQGGGGEGGGQGGGAPAAQAMLRVAHLSPDAPAVDFCATGAMPNFIGPLMKALGDTDGLAYSEVTKYFSVPAGTYTLRIVAPNADNCDGGLVDVDNVALAEGGYTAAAVGQFTPGAGDKPLEVKLLKDALTVPAGKTSLRFVHAVSDAPNVDVGFVSGGNFRPLFSDVTFGASPSFAGDPLTNVTVGIRVTGTTDIAITLPGLSIAADEIVTAFAIGNADNMPESLKALVCADNGEPVGSLSECEVLPQ